MPKRIFCVMILLALAFALPACSDGSMELAGAWITDCPRPAPRTLLFEEKKLVKDIFTYPNVRYAREGENIVIHDPGYSAKYIVTILDKDTIRVRCDYYRFECNYTRTTKAELIRIRGW